MLLYRSLGWNMLLAQLIHLHAPLATLRNAIFQNYQSRNCNRHQQFSIKMEHAIIHLTLKKQIYPVRRTVPSSHPVAINRSELFSGSKWLAGSMKHNECTSLPWNCKWRTCGSNFLSLVGAQCLWMWIWWSWLGKKNKKLTMWWKMCNTRYSQVTNSKTQQCGGVCHYALVFFFWWYTKLCLR